MFGTLLIANRGEIARRIARTARRMGLRVVAVYSEADALAPHRLEADDAVCIGPPPARESYLLGDKIIAAAKATGAEAIHPGYGFLSENADFAEAVITAGLTWVGAPPAAIRAMGLKDAAKSLMARAGVSVTPGYHGAEQSPDHLLREAERIGFPVLIKAIAGGGGKGMRKVEMPGGFAGALASAKREAKSSFGDDRILIEKYVSRPRHIEVQVFGDRHGNVVHFFERDCSLQRRHQKVIEEAPAPGMSDEVRDVVCDAAVRAAKAVAYEGAGTVEFIADTSDGLQVDRIWFMEMNTRLQVEHPVTEAITGVDLVEWQLRVAAGESLPRPQSEIRIEGHAIEARLYAEDPAKGFLPSPGPLIHCELPRSARIETGVEQGQDITPFYDPLIAKLIAHAPTRAAAAAKLAGACERIDIWPVKTNAAFLARALSHPEFLSGNVSTDFIDEHKSTLACREIVSQAVLDCAATAILAEARSTDPDPRSPWSSLTGFRLNQSRECAITVSDGHRSYEAALKDPVIPSSARAHVLQGSVVVFDKGAAFLFQPPHVDVEHVGASLLDGILRAPMPGRVSGLSASAGDAVRKGQVVIVLEAMKMEHAVTAAFDGRLDELAVGLGQQVSEGAILGRLSPPREDPE